MNPFADSQKKAEELNPTSYLKIKDGDDVQVLFLREKNKPVRTAQVDGQWYENDDIPAGAKVTLRFATRLYNVTAKCIQTWTHSMTVNGQLLKLAEKHGDKLFDHIFEISRTGSEKHNTNYNFSRGDAADPALVSTVNLEAESDIPF